MAPSKTPFARPDDAFATERPMITVYERPPTHTIRLTLGRELVANESMVELDMASSPTSRV